MMPKWSVKTAARITGAGLTSLLAIAAFGVVGMSGDSLEIGQDLNRPIDQIVNLPNQVFEVACMPGIIAESGPIKAGSTFIIEGEGIEVLQAVDLEGGSEIQGKQSGEATTFASKSAVGLTLQAQSGAKLQAITRGEASEDDLRGLIVGKCQAPRALSWFTVGATTVGESAMLTVANPTQQATKVSVKGWSASGPLSDNPTFTVGPRSSQTVNLAAYFPENERLGVSVEASGPGAVASIHTVGMDGLAPQGTDAVTGSEEPSKTVALVGLQEGLQDPKLRLMNPGTEPVNAEVTLLTENGLVGLSGSETIEIDPEAVFQLSLDGLATKVATVMIAASEPILASMSATAVGEPNQDKQRVADRVVWMPAQTATQFATVVPPTGGKGEAKNALHVANPTETPVSVTINGKDKTVEPFSTLTQPVDAGALTVEAKQPVYASLTISVDREDGKVISNIALDDLTATVPTTKLVVDR
ncbi:MAG: DUF5719 family protein [Actinomycetaceae bacterium]|nr:DUF5719 family protein [Actinomycetaceae bacterium]